MNCPNCNAEMRPLLTSWYCSAECDKHEPTPASERRWVLSQSTVEYLRACEMFCWDPTVTPSFGHPPDEQDLRTWGKAGRLSVVVVEGVVLTATPLHVGRVQSVYGV